MLRRTIFFSFMVFAIGLAPAQVMAHDEEYLDNRSSSKLLITSYVNALNTQQYVRAWSYWETENTGKTYEDFVEVHEEPVLWGIKLGNQVTEGAAGSVFTQVPFAMFALYSGGEERVTRGCFTIRAILVELQRPPFVPMRIWDATSTSVKSTFEDTELEICD